MAHRDPLVWAWDESNGEWQESWKGDDEEFIQEKWGREENMTDHSLKMLTNIWWSRRIRMGG